MSPQRLSHASIRLQVLSAILALLTSACAGERPLVERREDGAWRPEAFQLASLSGERDGADVSFIAELQGEGARRIIVEGAVVIDPRARLVDGHWWEEGGTELRSGIVSAGSVDFLGGQGSRPSLGGQFTLRGADGPLYRVSMPTRELQAAAGVIE